MFVRYKGRVCTVGVHMHVLPCGDARSEASGYSSANGFGTPTFYNHESIFNTIGPADAKNNL